MADRYIPEHRRNQFKAKNAFKPDELRRRREEQQVEIRKNKREENLAKRRGLGPGPGHGSALGAAPDSDDEAAPTESQVRFAFINYIHFIIYCYPYHTFLLLFTIAASPFLACCLSFLLCFLPFPCSAFCFCAFWRGEAGPFFFYKLVSMTTPHSMHYGSSKLSACLPYKLLCYAMHYTLVIAIP